MEGLTAGRIVHYVLDTGRHVGEHRPAIVIYVLTLDANPGRVNLCVFIDGTNDYHEALNHQGGVDLIVWKMSVPNDEETKAPGTWHWIERA
jgi:hypothetical protein